MAQEIRLAEIEPGAAAALLSGLERLDPAGTTADVGALAQAGRSFQATASDGASAVYVVAVRNGVAWVSACAGAGAVPWVDVLLPVIEHQAESCDAVAFQTARPGLVRAARRHGYSVAGWILKKDLT